MAYEKQTWTTGDVITQEKLNHMEDGIANAGGYECVEETKILFDGTVNLYWTGNFGTATVESSATPTSESVTVVLDGETVELPRVSEGSYGDFSNPPIPVTYPVNLSFYNGNCSIYANVQGEHTMLIKAPMQKVITTECFKKAIFENTPSNLKNGGAVGSLRGVLAKEEDNDYKMGANAVALGSNTSAEGVASHAEGNNSEASGAWSHAEGSDTLAEGESSHAEGNYTQATGSRSHAEGEQSIASGDMAHAEGWTTKASGRCSHAEGQFTKASGNSQHVEGKYNIEDTNNTYAHIVGNGTNSARSNAFALKWDGTFVFADGTEITPAQFAALKALLNQ